MALASELAKKKELDDNDNVRLAGIVDSFKTDEAVLRRLNEKEKLDETDRKVLADIQGRLVQESLDNVAGMSSLGSNFRDDQCEKVLDEKQTIDDMDKNVMALVNAEAGMGSSCEALSHTAGSIKALGMVIVPDGLASMHDTLEQDLSRGPDIPLISKLKKISD